MTKQENQQQIIDNLKSIVNTAQNCLDAFYADQLEYKYAETSMNYIRLCTQKVQHNLTYQKNE